jgi:dihydroflavonol-4-reductase
VTVLLTGATGFLGSAVLRRLVAEGEAVRVLVRPSSDRRNLEGVDCEIVEGDLSEPESLRPAVAGCDALYHVAADYRLWVPDPDVLHRVNVEGTIALLCAAVEAGVSRIVYTSSVATLGLTNDRTQADEATPTSLEKMVGQYKRSKYLAEDSVRQLIEKNGYPVIIVNPSAPIGPRDIKPTPTGRMILDAATGRMPAYVDTGLNVVHVDDVAEGHLLAFRKGEVGERYLLGAEDMTLQDIFAIVADHTGRRPPRIKLPHNLIMPIAHCMEAVARVTGKEPRVTADGVRMARKHMYFSHGKARRALGYAPRPAADAIRDAVDWFHSNEYLT